MFRRCRTERCGFAPTLQAVQVSPMSLYTERCGFAPTLQAVQVSPMSLYVVATPIGNLRDLTERAREVLLECDGVIAEDTRHSGNLLKHLGIRKPLHSLPAFDEAARVEPLVRRLAGGESLALGPDAGAPAGSDPASDLGLGEVVEA